MLCVSKRQLDRWALRVGVPVDAVYGSIDTTVLTVFRDVCGWMHRCRAQRVQPMSSVSHGFHGCVRRRVPE